MRWNVCRFSLLPSTAGCSAQLCCTDRLQVHSKFRRDSAMKVVICALVKAAAEQFSRWQFKKKKKKNGGSEWTCAKSSQRGGVHPSSLSHRAEFGHDGHEQMDGWKGRKACWRSINWANNVQSSRCFKSVTRAFLPPGFLTAVRTDSSICGKR